MDRLLETGKNFGMEINIDNSEVMKIGKEELLRTVMGNQILKNVNQCKHLGSLLTVDANCTKEIRSQIVIAKTDSLRRYHWWQAT